MKPAPFEYRTPGSIAEVLDMLAEVGDDAVILAGGQSLMPLMRLRLARPEVVISTRRLASELSYVRAEETRPTIGALTTLAKLATHNTQVLALRGVGEAARLVGHHAVRTRGTLGGNLVHADPASELPAIALALRARFHLQSLSNDRYVPASDFYLGPYMSAKADDELLVEVVFDEGPVLDAIAIKEITRVPGGFALAGVVVGVGTSADGKVDTARVACFGVGATAVRVPEAEAIIASDAPSKDAVMEAAAVLGSSIEPHSDPFATADYRRAAAMSLFRRALADALGQLA